MSVVFQMPVRTHENFGDSIAKLIKTLSEVSSSKEKEIILDFSHTKILNPFFLCGLSCIIQQLQNLEKIFVPKYDENSHINSYLKTIFFPSSLSLSANNNENLKILDNYKGKTYIPIITFQTGFNESCTLLGRVF